MVSTPAAGLLVLVLGLADLSGTCASRPATEGVSVAAEAYGTHLQSLVSQVHKKIETGLNSSYLHALQEERKYTSLFSHLQEGLDNFTHNSRHLQARILQDRLGELHAIQEALATQSAEKVVQAVHAGKEGGAERSGEGGQRLLQGPAVAPAVSTLGAEIRVDGSQRPARTAAVGAPRGEPRKTARPEEHGLPAARLRTPPPQPPLVDHGGASDGVDAEGRLAAGSLGGAGPTGAAPAAIAAIPPLSHEGSEVLDALEALGE